MDDPLCNSQPHVYHHENPHAHNKQAWIPSGINCILGGHTKQGTSDKIRQNQTDPQGCV